MLFLRQFNTNPIQEAFDSGEDVGGGGGGSVGLVYVLFMTLVL